MSNLRLSRPLGVAAALRGSPLSEAEVLSRRVLLIGDASALTTANGRWCFLNALRLLARITGALSVHCPSTDALFTDQVGALIRTVHTQGRVDLLDEPFELAAFYAILGVGHECPEGGPWTVINSEGWLARVSSRGNLPASTGSPNPMAALMAASLGVTEVFKRVYEVPFSIAPEVQATEFSLFDLSTSSREIGPPLDPRTAMPDTLLVGAGAIGNGIALLLAQLEWRGGVHLIDKQDFGEENYGTCTLLDSADWIGESKAAKLGAWLMGHGISATHEKAFIAQASSGERLKAMRIELLLNALDDVQARHDAQMLWPAVTVDGGINAVGAAVVTFRLDRPGMACLRCAFDLPTTDERAIQRAATGLDDAALGDPDQLLSEEDIANAEESHRPWLSQMRERGMTRCAVVSEAVRLRLGLSLEPGFLPSAPFVATAAAALVIAQAIKSLAFPMATYVHQFQIESLFLGLESSVATRRAARSTCLCMTQRAAIDHVHAQRQSKREPVAGSANGTKAG